jgi:hypothetical protein
MMMMMMMMMSENMVVIAAAHASLDDRGTQVASEFGVRISETA